MVCYLPKVTQQGWRSWDSAPEPQQRVLLSPCDGVFKTATSYPTGVHQLPQGQLT